MKNLILFTVFIFLAIPANADEKKTDDLPVKYKDAQDIMAGKKISGKKKKPIRELTIPGKQSLKQSRNIVTNAVEALPKEEPSKSQMEAFTGWVIPPLPDGIELPKLSAETMGRLK
jgi:hypothetical protein